MVYHYDIIVFGGGIAGLFLANRLQRAGYNLILIEKDSLGGVQTLASQGMIHGGQKYALEGKVTAHAAAISEMPARWDACFGGWGDVNLSGVKTLSDTQVMFPAGGSLLSGMMVFAAAKAVNGKTQKLKREWFPEVLKNRKKSAGGFFKNTVYEMQEKVLETKTLIAELAKNLQGRIFKGAVTELLPDGQVAVSGLAFQAQVIIFAAGSGNEAALQLLRIREPHSQRRPLRQIMVKPLPYALYGHGIIGKPKPRVTITSHAISGGTSQALGDNEYIWYLGGNIAEEGAKLSEAEALQFARQEMTEIFPDIDWTTKEWASFTVDRAEPFSAKAQLPAGPHFHQRGRILFAWPTKMTFVPALSDSLFDWLQQNGIQPSPKKDGALLPPLLPLPDIGLYPWEGAQWQKL